MRDVDLDGGRRVSVVGPPAEASLEGEDQRSGWRRTFSRMTSGPLTPRTVLYVLRGSETWLGARRSPIVDRGAWSVWRMGCELSSKRMAGGRGGRGRWRGRKRISGRERAIGEEVRKVGRCDLRQAWGVWWWNMGHGSAGGRRHHMTTPLQRELAAGRPWRPAPWKLSKQQVTVQEELGPLVSGQIRSRV